MSHIAKVHGNSFTILIKIKLKILMRSCAPKIKDSSHGLEMSEFLDYPGDNPTLIQLWGLVRCKLSEFCHVFESLMNGHLPFAAL
jgi:hypothetical protein